MSERVLRDFRRQASKVAKATVAVLSQPITAALENEQVTRLRVDALEKELQQTTQRVIALEPMVRNLTWTHRESLWGRLRWLLTGL